MTDAFAFAVSRPRFGGVDGACALRRSVPRPQPVIFTSFLCFETHSSRCGGSRRRHENPRPLHVHRHRDELKVAVVALQAAIADLRHPIPVLHRRIGALDPDAHAGRRLVEPFLPIGLRLAALALIADLVVDPLVLELVAQRLAVIGLVAAIGLFIALDYREPALADGAGFLPVRASAKTSLAMSVSPSASSSS